MKMWGQQVSPDPSRTGHSGWVPAPGHPQGISPQINTTPGSEGLFLPPHFLAIIHVILPLTAATWVHILAFLRAGSYFLPVPLVQENHLLVSTGLDNALLYS